MTRRLFAIKAAAVLLCLGSVADAQTKFNSGQNVQPVFEGWEKNPDGSFNLMFGYLNRNYVEQPHVSVGTQNFFSPGETDRGQPTHFYPGGRTTSLRCGYPRTSAITTSSGP